MKKKLTLIICLVVACLFGTIMVNAKLSTNFKQTDLRKKTYEDRIVLKNDEYKFELPKAWLKYPYLVEQNGTEYSFYSKTNYDRIHAGYLFSIGSCTKKKWEKICWYEGTLLATRNNRVYYIVGPTDFPVDESSKRCIKEYQTLLKGRNRVEKTFEFIEE